MSQNELAQARANLVAMLDECDTLSRLSSLLEVSDVITDPSHAACLIDLYLTESGKHLDQLRDYVGDTRSLLKGKPNLKAI